MVEPITQERWEQALSGELNHYDYGNAENYKRASMIILKDHFNVDLENDLVGKKVLEVGGGAYPSVLHVTGLAKAVSVEPNFDNFPQDVKDRFESANIEGISIPFEEYKGRTKFDEVWFFNVLQHVRDPLLQIENAKKIAKTIRVFEPIDTATNNEHPHTFSETFFKEQFPESEVSVYHGGSIGGFHGANCAYLTWTKNDKKKTSKS